MTYKTFMLILLTLLIAMIVSFLLPPFSKAEAASSDYVAIGNGIKRTDDLSKGVACYMSSGGSQLSCVKVK